MEIHISAIHAEASGIIPKTVSMLMKPSSMREMKGKVDMTQSKMRHSKTNMSTMVNPSTPHTMSVSGSTRSSSTTSRSPRTSS